MGEPQLYLLAGLGFDQRIFYNLQINYGKINYLDWLEPSKNKTLGHYVLRIAEQIEPGKSPIILIGHSFGGIIVQEMSKLISAEKVIIISSIKSKSELLAILNFLRIIPLYKFLSKQMILKSFPFWAKLFGYKSKKGRELFIDMISKCTTHYCRWSMDKIVNWNGTLVIKNLIHIHGSKDMTFPVRLIENLIVVKDGSHFMVYSKAEELSEFLNRELKLSS